MIAVNDEWILKGAVPDGINDIGTAYFRCKKLRHIEIPASVKSITCRAFSGCESLESVTIPESVTEIGREAFDGCKSLKRINLPENLKSLEGGAFDDCESLEEIILPDSITEIKNYAFSGCKSLKRINLPVSITKIAYGVFSSCESLKTITLPDNLTSIGGHAFSSCKSLERITLPDSISEIGEYAFASCNSLKRITLPENLTSLEKGTFHNCASLEELSLPDSITEIGEEAFRGCKSLKRINLPQNLKSIEYCTFYECESLEELVLPDSITEIKQFAFAYCKSIKRLTLQENITLIEQQAFIDCKSLEELSLPASITEILPWTFEGCKSLKKITLPKNLKSIGEEAFRNCASLDELILPNSITEIGKGAFQGCTSLKKITLPNNLASIGGAAFSGCKSLEELTMSGSITEIGKSFLQSCKSIKKINITGGVSSIPDDYFKGLTQLTEVTLSEGLKSIGRRAFNNTGLIYVILPESLKEIGDGAFSNCHSLETVYINNPNTIFGYRTFANSENLEFVTGDYDVAAFERAQANYGTKHKSIYEEKQKGIETQQEAERPESEMRVAGNVTMSEPTPDGAVDLGLSVKWATCNLGANSPEEYGGYYQWAGTRDVTSTSINLQNSCPYNTGYPDTGSWTKYCPISNSSVNGNPDYNTVLNPSDDVAHVKLGGNWRIPTKEEFDELMNNCNWIWTTQNGVPGYKVTSKKTGYTGRSIFLPATGHRALNFFYYFDPEGYYWSSSLDAKSPRFAHNIFFRSGKVSKDHSFREHGLSVRPVYSGKISVTGIILYPTRLILTTDNSYSLKATATPSNIAEQDVIWSSDNTSVARVDKNGKVTAVKAGSATITVKTTEGGYTSSCRVTVKHPTPVGAVDLGLSVKWATCNLGATSPEEYGGIYQWAGTRDVGHTVTDWTNCPYHKGNEEGTGWTKYVTSDESSCWSGSGNPDNKTVLDPSDDAAHVNWGGNWRMPTWKEWKELIDNCTWTWVTQDGVNGFEVKSKVPGYTNRSIFLPAAGKDYGSYSKNVGSFGNYWSSSLCKSLPFDAYQLVFDPDNPGGNGEYRSRGRSVRPVCQ